MAPLIKKPTMGDVLKDEYNPNFTREVVTMLTGAIYPAGSVVGRITSGGKHKLATAGGSDGAQTAAGVLLREIDATDGDVAGAVILKRGPAIVSADMLTFDDTVDDDTKKAAKLAELEALNIVARTTA
jgi:hypothetical protein